MNEEEKIEQSQEDEKTEAVNLTSDINTSEIKTMEVHHHPHVEKKSFKEYLLEGLMIFLAVTMGFIAENIREGIIERQKEHEYIESIVEDLKEDQKYFDERINYFENKLEQLDTLINIANTKGKIENTELFYYYGNVAARYESIVLHTGTIDEIKNGGGLHLIRKQKIPKRMMEYYNYLNVIKNVEDRMSLTDDKYRQAFIEVADPVVFESFSPWKSNSRIDIGTNPPLRNYSQDALAKLSGNILFMRVLRSRVFTLVEELQKNGKNLLALIQKEYHLENE